MGKMRHEKSKKSSRLAKYQFVESRKTKRTVAKLVDDWKDCQACPLRSNRTNVVHWRGTLPCDILFIGEAPGESEDIIGVPFVGSAGKLLDEMIFEASTNRPASPTFNFLSAKELDSMPSFAITNIVACLPLDLYGNLSPPKKQEARTCGSRLRQFISIAQPQVIVALGSIAEKYIPTGEIPHYHLVHPAAILRSDSKYVLLRKKFVIGLRKILEEVR